MYYLAANENAPPTQGKCPFGHGSSNGLTAAGYVQLALKSLNEGNATEAREHFLAAADKVQSCSTVTQPHIVVSEGRRNRTEQLGLCSI